MDPALLCKMFFTAGTAVDIGGTLFPSFREQIMNYGSRRTNPPVTAPRTSRSNMMKLADYLASFQVPHSWFIHYYIVSVACSLFWAFQILTRGSTFQLLAYYAPKSASGNMTVNQVLLAWGFMLIQGTRRLYECIMFTKPSQAKMWAGLWLIGIAYYIAMSLSVWIEGITVLSMPPSSTNFLSISSPSTKTWIAAFLFISSSIVQHDCHRYLASLKKYTLPQRGVFRWVVCPHYTSECLIYIAIAMASAPRGQTLNKTVLAGITFVVSNLAVTADSTRNWYIEKFGVEKVSGRWRMVPYVF